MGAATDEKNGSRRLGSKSSNLSQTARRWAAATVRLLRRNLVIDALITDKLLGAVTLLLAAFALSPLFMTPFLPLADLPDNTGQGAMFLDVMFGRGLPGYHYKIQWLPVPYWTTHLLIAFLAPLFGALNAAKIMVGMVVLGMPLAIMRLLKALGRDPRLGLWGFLLSWEHNLYAGWTAYLLGMLLAIWGLAWLLEARSNRDALKVGVLAVVLGVTHIEAVAYFGLSAAFLLLVRRPFLKALVLHTIAVSGLAVSVVPWLISRLGDKANGGKVQFSFDLHAPRDKLSSFHGYSLDNLPKPEDATLTAFAFLLLLIGVPLLASVVGSPPGAARPTEDAAPAGSAALLVLAPLALYMSLPMAISGPVSHWYTYPRYASFVLAGLLLLPRLRFERWQALWLVPGVLLAPMIHLRIARQFADYGTRAAPFLQIIAHVRPNSAYLPLEMDDSDPATRLDTFNQIHAYIGAIKKGYDPHLFDNNSIPFLYRSERRLPQTAWNRPQDFSLSEHGRYYDYVVVQGGLDRDPLRGIKPSGNLSAKLVVEAGRFRLYEIIKG